MAQSEHLLLLDSEELLFTKTNHTKENWLIFAAMLKFFQAKGRYPNEEDPVSPNLITSLAQQLDVPEIQFNTITLEHCSVKRLRQEIRQMLGYQTATIADSERLIQLLIAHILPESSTFAQCTEEPYKFFRVHKL